MGLEAGYGGKAGPGGSVLGAKHFEKGSDGMGKSEGRESGTGGCSHQTLGTGKVRWRVETLEKDGSGKKGTGEES